MFKVQLVYIIVTHLISDMIFKWDRREKVLVDLQETALGMDCLCCCCAPCEGSTQRLQTEAADPVPRNPEHSSFW